MIESIGVTYVSIYNLFAFIQIFTLSNNLLLTSDLFAIFDVGSIEQHESQGGWIASYWVGLYCLANFANALTSLRVSIFFYLLLNHCALYISSSCKFRVVPVVGCGHFFIYTFYLPTYPHCWLWAL